MSGYVYFIGAIDERPFVKIGWALHNPFGRLSQLQTGCPEHLIVYTYFRGTLQDERRLHRTFGLLHYRGEWFINDLRLRDFIDYLTEFDDKLEQECPRERFEDAIWDVLVSGFEHPDREDVKLYQRSGQPQEWRHLFPDDGQ